MTSMEFPGTALNIFQLLAIITGNSITGVAEASSLETPLNRLSGRTCHETLTNMQIYNPCNIQYGPLLGNSQKVPATNY